MNILVVNTGSSTVKTRLFDMEGEKDLFAGRIDGVGSSRSRIVVRAGGGPPSRRTSGALDVDACLRLLAAEMAAALEGGPHLAGIGHRVVHGGERFTAPRLVDRELLRELSLLDSLAPLHNPACLAGVAAAEELFPGTPQAVCFDTAFHATQPFETSVVPLPAAYREAGLRRYGFHGLSFEHVAALLPGIAGRKAKGRVIAAHLGGGVSLCAMQGLESVATTMGFSTLDGPPMATRCGSLDPGIILHLMKESDMDHDALAELLYRRSGLLGLSGISGDMRALLDSPSPAAAAAVAVFVYRVVREIGSLAAALGGLDLLVFTGGIGENSPAVRERICRSLAWLGVAVDETANRRGARSITADGSAVGVFVLPAGEELVIARHTQRLLLNQKGRNESPQEERS